MERLTLFLLGALLLSTSGFAQDSETIEVRWSRGYKNSEIQFDYVTSLDSASFMTYGSTSRSLFSNAKYYYSRYDRLSMELIWQVEETINKYRDAPITFNSMVNYGQITYVFYQAYSKANDVRFVLLRTIDAEGNISDFIELDRITAKNAYTGGFKVSWNSSATSFAVVSFPEEDPKKEVQVEVKRFDLEGNRLGGASVTLDYASLNVGIIDLDYAINGDVYILAVRRPERTENEKRFFFAPNQEFFILHANPNDEVFQEVDLELKDKFVVGGIGVEADEIPGKVAISGMYSDKRFGSTSGMFYMTLDQSTIEPSTSDFINLREFDYINDGRTDGTSRARLKGLANETYVFRGMVPREGGGSLVLMEDYDLVVRTTQNGDRTVTTFYDYYYDNILAMMVDAQGEIERVSVIPKQQFSVNDGGVNSGFLLVRDRENFKFLFNDTPGNDQRWAKNQAPMSMAASHKANLVQVTLKPDGTLVYTPLIENRKEKAILMPRRGRSYLGSPGEAVIPGSKRGKWVFMSLRPERN